MTIRTLMVATFAMAVSFSLLDWNWGIAVFATACVPLGACLSVRNFLSRFKVLRIFAFTASIAVIYPFSCGPYFALIETVYGNDDTPPSVVEVTRFLYAPLWSLVDGSPNNPAGSSLSGQVESFINAYHMEWGWFGSDVGVFVRALIP